MEDCNGCCVESAYCSDEEVADHTSVTRSPSPPLSPTSVPVGKLTWQREEQQVDVAIIGKLQVVSRRLRTCVDSVFLFYSANRQRSFSHFTITSSLRLPTSLAVQPPKPYSRREIAATENQLLAFRAGINFGTFCTCQISRITAACSTCTCSAAGPWFVFATTSYVHFSVIKKANQ